MAAKMDLRAALSVGRNALDRGRVCEIAEWTRSRPRRVEALIELLWDDDAGVASRAADVLERTTHQPTPALLRAVSEYKEAMLGLLADARFPKLRWNLALTLPRLVLTVPECRRMAAVMEAWLGLGLDAGLGDRSSIVKTAALHGLAGLTRYDLASLAIYYLFNIFRSRLEPLQTTGALIVPCQPG